LAGMGNLLFTPEQAIQIRERVRSFSLPEPHLQTALLVGSNP